MEKTLMHATDREALKLLRDPLCSTSCKCLPSCHIMLCLNSCVSVGFMCKKYRISMFPFPCHKNQAISQICTYNATLHLSNTYVAQTGNQDIFTLPLWQKHFKHLKTDKHNMQQSVTSNQQVIHSGRNKIKLALYRNCRSTPRKRQNSFAKGGTNLKVTWRRTRTDIKNLSS